MTILGFLIERPMHGYALRKALSPALPRDQQLNDGVLYPLLDKLDREGLIRRKTVKADGRKRTVCSATKKGERVFDDWLRSDAEEDDEVSYDFLVGQPFLRKCLFFDRLGQAELREKVTAQRSATRAKLDRFAEIKKGMLDRGVTPVRIRILDLGIAQHRAKLRWLSDLERDLVSMKATTEPALEMTT